LSYIFKALSNNEKLSTITLAKKFNTTTRILQLDFTEYILPFFDDKSVFYNFSAKAYQSKNSFLDSTLLDSEELAILSILKAKSKDKYSDTTLLTKTNKLFEKIQDESKDAFFSNLAFKNNKKNYKTMIKLKNAIDKKQQISCLISKDKRQINPLKLLVLEKDIFLVCYDLAKEKNILYRLSLIEDIKILKTNFALEQNNIENFDNAINKYFDPSKEPFEIRLELKAKISKYFENNKINQTQELIKGLYGEKCEIKLYITNINEVVGLIQKNIPNIKAIYPEELTKTIKWNLYEYFRKIT
jgi:predicted DNA-binding transcriptional regulator YafY